ncbi:MAG: hypothetical protein WDN07_01885 [Actinomycetota bacterium]
MSDSDVSQLTTIVVKARWNEVLDNLLERDRIAWLAFFDARIVSVESGILTINFVDATKFGGDHDFSLARNPKHIQLLQEIIEATFGTHLEIKRDMKRLIITIALVLSLIGNVASATITPAKIDALGPGDRIHGMDISYYQHPGNASIISKKMYAAGIRFVIIKGGDTVDSYDAQALKYMVPDRKAAQAALMYTSFYYYATLPNTNDKTVITKDAKAQAQKVIWRIASLGGYNKRDLPVALDMENNCVVVKSGVCTKYTSDANVTLWAQTWLDTVAAANWKETFYLQLPPIS